MISKIGKYDIIREIGMGGMSTVYQAYDPFRDNFVAIKTPRLRQRSTEAEREGFERLFFNEMNTASSLNHPNIIKVYDAGVPGGVHYIAMEYIAGSATLRKFCKLNNLLPLELAGQIFLKCAEALDYAHSKGVIHRDIKPGNIMLQNERDVKVSDFGLALLSDPDMMDTQTIGTMGTPKYMAPEMLEEGGITERVDIYSLGVVMYEVLTGKAPFRATSIAALTKKILNDTPPPPSQVRDNVPVILDRVVSKAMAKDPADRYVSMLELAADLSVCFQNLDSPLDTGKTERRTVLLKRLSFFNDFDDAEIWELLRWSEWREVEDGEVIISEGEIGDAMYLLIQGELVVSKEGQAITILPEGEIFGEMAFLTMRRRTATVKARGPSTILRLNITQIDRASESCQIQFQRLLISTLTDRLAKTTEQVVHGL